jgi:predicted nucleic acid-binding protein
VLDDKACIAVLDDMAARKCSLALNIRCIGTAGILVLAGRRRLLPSLENAFSAVRNAGLYLSYDLVNRLIEAEHKRS